MTNAQKIDHATNNLYSTTYTVVMINKVTRAEVVIGTTSRKTRSIMLDILFDRAESVISHIGSDLTQTFKVLKGMVELEGTPWIVRFGDTLYQLNGQTVQMLV